MIKIKDRVKIISTYKNYDDIDISHGNHKFFNDSPNFGKIYKINKILKHKVSLTPINNKEIYWCNISDTKLVISHNSFSKYRKT